MAQVAWLNPSGHDFPPISQALKDPNGLLAAGGDLSPERLLQAYRSGIFPWYENDQPLLWWSPDPRCVLRPDKIRISRSLAKRLRRNEFEVRLNTNFRAVIEACSAPRIGSTETWITGEMTNAYVELHRLGFAHSVECYQGQALVGGLYGLSLGRLFFGESMFHQVTDASKVAFAYLCRLLEEQNCPLIDCQIVNPHLLTLGCETMSRESFQTFLHQFCDAQNSINWDKLPELLPDW